MVDVAPLPDMEAVRAKIDRLDRELMALLVARQNCIDRAAVLKAKSGEAARVNWRVEEVAQNARKNAQIEGFDPDLAEQIWRQLIEWSIAREDHYLETGK